MHSLPKTIIALVLLFSAVLGYALPLSDIVERQDPPWPAVNIEAIGYAGSGCPANSVNIVPQNNFQEVKLEFISYVAMIGPHIPQSENRKNCAITLLISHPPGWSIAVYQADYKGRLQLDDGVDATQRSEYWWDGDTAELESNWFGPQPWQDYSFTDILNKEVWSSCKGNSLLKANTQIRLDNSKNPDGSGFITTDSITNKVTHICYLKWKKC
ncbi:hypothetical protein BDZ91DRAFT_697864 [Kalaharituber pfeilii]|nr:hypothetical protein BDZ91DRAFT_697864 [Kalaharituber pfeilii]